MNWFKSFWKRLNEPQARPEQPAAGPKVSFWKRVWLEMKAALSGKTDNLNRSRHARTQELDEEHYCNFTPRALQVLSLARKEADRFNHRFVGTEHLLLGLIKLGQGVAVNVLQRRGVNLEETRVEVEKFVGTGPEKKLIGNIPFTPRVKKVLHLAQKEAMNLHHTYVGTEHILLGLLREGDGVAARVFKNLAVDIETTRNEILRELDPGLSASEADREVLERFKLSQAGESVLQKSAGTAQLKQQHNFTPRAQQVLALARKEADRLNHNFVGTEHLLLGMLTMGQGGGFNALVKQGLVVETIRMEIEKQVGKGPEQKIIGNIPYTPRTKKVLALAAKESKALGHTYVGTEHILLGLLREGDGVAARVLKNLNIHLEETRAVILKELDPNLAANQDGRMPSDTSRTASPQVAPIASKPEFSVEHLGLPARNPTALKDWYVSVLDAKLVFENGQTPPAYFLALPGGMILEIYQADASLAETSNHTLAGWRHVALRVEAIETARDALMQKGVQFPDPIKPAGGGGRVLFFRDPEQNLLHLIERPGDSIFRRL